MTPEDELAALERLRAVCLSLPEAEELVRAAYLKVAPKRLAEMLVEHLAAHGA